MHEQLLRLSLGIAQGAIGQLRYMGAAIGVAIVTCTFNSHVKSHLSEVLSPEQLNQLLVSVSSIGVLPSPLRDLVRLELARAYNIQVRILMGFSICQAAAALLMWKRKQVKFALDVKS